MSDTRDTWTCRTILHDGDGPPGPERKLLFVHRVDAAEAAEFHAENEHDNEMLEDGGDDSDYDGCRMWVEVLVGDPVRELMWERFLVRCRVVRQYKAEKAA